MQKTFSKLGCATFLSFVLGLGLTVQAEDSKTSPIVAAPANPPTNQATSAGPESQWTAICSRKGKFVTLLVKSKSGDPFEDDMQAQVQFGFKKISVPYLKALYRPIAPSKKFQLCSNTVGMPVDKGQMLILFAKDDRPALEELTAVLIDPQTQKVLDVNKNLGAFFREPEERQLRFERTVAGFRAYVVQGFNRSKMTDAAQDLMMGWVNVVIKGGKIQAKWEKALPETHGIYSTPSVSNATDSVKK